MVEGGGGTAFPVIFFDGEREINIGSVKVEAKQVYKSFQFMLAHKIGISPNQISIYLVDRRNPKSPETRRKFPITARSNFSQICKEKDCSFLVVLKRSRKTRTRQQQLSGSEFDFTPRVIPENVVLLRRDDVVNPYDSPLYDHIVVNPYNSSLYDQNKNYSRQYASNQYAFPRMEEAFPMMRRYFCEECRIAEENGERVEFHPCVNDVVVEEFRGGGSIRPIGPVRWRDINIANKGV